MFVDEAGATTAMVRTHGRAPKGQRACGAAPAGRWRRLTVLGALGADGVAAAMSVEAATDTAVVLACLDRVLTPELRRAKPGSRHRTDPDSRYGPARAVPSEASRTREL